MLTNQISQDKVLLKMSFRSYSKWKNVVKIDVKLRKTKTFTSKLSYLSFSVPGFLVLIVQLEDDGDVLVGNGRITSGNLKKAGSQVVVHGNVCVDAVLSDKFH